MSQIYEKLYAEMTAELNASTKEQGRLQILAGSLSILRRYLRLLKESVIANGFQDEGSEIIFFKEIKPRFYSQMIYTLSAYTLEVNKPVGTIEQQRHYLETELQQVQRFFNQYPYHYQYYRTGASDLDHLYFLRGKTSDVPVVTDMPEIDGEFSTSCDYLFAKFKAYEILRDDILQSLNPAKTEENVIPDVKKKKERPKTLFGISVDQLGLMARSADDARLVLGRSFSSICEDLAPFCSTSEKESISPGSLRSNAYVGELSDKQVVIRYLEKMIGFIKEY